jgi:hypothetical protein
MSRARGFSPIIIVVVVAVLALGGFLLFKSGKLPLPGAVQIASRVTEKDFESVTDATLRKHFVAQTNANAVRSVSQSSGKGTKDTMEYQIKGDSFSYRMKEEEADKELSHVIMLGDTTYIKDLSDNKWWKQTKIPDEEVEDLAATPDDIKEEFMTEDPTLYKSLGTEACGNLTCHKYEQTFKDSPGARTFWFDTKKFLIRKEESAYGEFSSSIEYSYDGISISAPSPTKDVPEGKNIYEYYTPGGGSYTPPTSTGSNDTPTAAPTNYSFDTPTDYDIPADDTPADSGY